MTSVGWVVSIFSVPKGWVVSSQHWMGSAIIHLPSFHECSRFLVMGYGMIFVDWFFVEVNFVQYMLKLQQVLVVNLGIPIGIPAIIWIDIRWNIVIKKGNGPESSSETGSIFKILSWNWFLIQMSVVVRNKGSFFHLLLPDNRRIPH